MGSEANVERVPKMAHYDDGPRTTCSTSLLLFPSPIYLTGFVILSCFSIKFDLCYANLQP